MGNDRDIGFSPVNGLGTPDFLEGPDPEAPFAEWRKWAWRLGMAECHGGYGSSRLYLQSIAEICEFSDKAKASLLESFDTAQRRCRKPPDAPERVAECVRWYESVWGQVRTVEKIGRSPAYPKLLLFAYGLGRDGRPFAFAKNRIAEVTGIHEFTVLKFIRLALKEGWLMVVRDGYPGVNGIGIPTWYRIPSPTRIYSLLALDRQSYRACDHHATFEDLLRRRLPSSFPSVGETGE